MDFSEWSTAATEDDLDQYLLAFLDQLKAFHCLYDLATSDISVSGFYVSDISVLGFYVSKEVHKIDQQVPESGHRDSEKVCSALTSALSLHPKSALLVGETVALLATKESFRDVTEVDELLQSLVLCTLSSDLNTRLQVLRAVGNLCIDNDKNREVVLKTDGCHRLIKMIQWCLDTNNQDIGIDRYRVVLCGCILNFTNENEHVAKEFLRLGALDKISSLLLVPCSLGDAMKFGLDALGVLTEYASEDSAISSSFLSNVVQLLSLPTHDCLEATLELVKLVIGKENDELSLTLVRVGLLTELLLLAEKPEVHQQVADLVVLLLQNDKCMDLMFQETEIVRTVLKWLQPSSPQVFMANAALMVANLARSDSNCLKLVVQGVVPLLIGLVHLEEDSDKMREKLHHAALSALRNLSMPKEHKEAFFSMGVVDCAIRALKTSSMHHVLYKALGILRLLAEKQEITCSHIVTEAMERLNEVCDEVDISHIHIETGRLLSAIVKYCKNSDVSLKICKEGGLKRIYYLLQCTEQSQIVAEGLIALNIMLVLRSEETLAFLRTQDITNFICSALTSSFPLNVVNNTLELVKVLMERLKFLKSNAELCEALQNLTTSDNEDIRIKSLHILDSIKV